MKTKAFAKTMIVTVFLTTTIIATSSHAGTRQKPPVASTDVAAWYQPVLDFFKF